MSIQTKLQFLENCTSSNHANCLRKTTSIMCMRVGRITLLFNPLYPTGPFLAPKLIYFNQLIYFVKLKVLL